MRWPRMLMLAGVHGVLGAAAAILVALGCWCWSSRRETWALQFRSDNTPWERVIPVSSDLGEEQLHAEPHFRLLEAYNPTPPIDWNDNRVRASRWLDLLTGLGVANYTLTTTVYPDDPRIVESTISVTRIGWPVAILDGIVRKDSPGVEHRIGFLRTRSPARPWLPVRPILPNLILVSAAFATASLVLTLMAGASARFLLRRLRLRRNHCPRCNYNRQGLPPAAPCPECGPTPGRRT